MDPRWADVAMRYRPLAVRIATGLVGDETGGEEVFADVVRALWTRVRAGELTFESDEHLRNYLLRAVHNRAVDALRSASDTSARDAADELVGVAAEGASPEDAAAAREESARVLARRDAVDAALADLRDTEREALHLRYREGRTYREIAARTGASISTLQSRVEAALEKLRRRLDGSAERIGKPGGPS